MILRALITGLMLSMLAACTVFVPAQVPQQAVASTGVQQKTFGPLQLGRVTVDWQDVSILQQPQTEAKRLSEIIYSGLDRRSLISEQATDELQVTILEVFLRSGSRAASVSTDYMAGQIELLGGGGESKGVFRIKANYTQRGGDPVDAESRLDKLYTKFADLTVRELITNQETQTSAGVATAL